MRELIRLMMKTFAGLILLISLASLCVAKPKDLYISISLVIAQHSRDASSTETSFTVSGDRVIYDENYHGYRSSSRKPIHEEWILTGQEVANLTRLIQEKKLLRSRSFTTPEEASGFSTSYDLTEKIRWQGKMSVIRVSGPLNSAQSDAMKSNRLYQDANSLLEYLRAVTNLKRQKRP